MPVRVGQEVEEVLLVTLYRLAPNPIFWTIQGEGRHQGTQQAFLRLGGCSVACEGCDTDYSAGDLVSLEDIVSRLRSVIPAADRDCWIWITGGDPGDLPRHMQVRLINALKGQAWSTCLATSGHKRFVPPVDWLSVSPHSSDPAKFMQRSGDEVKLVDGLNGLSLDEWYTRWNDRTEFMYRYVQPLSVLRDGAYGTDPASLERCLVFLSKHPNWALSVQRHHEWGIQ